MIMNHPLENLAVCWERLCNTNRYHVTYVIFTTGSMSHVEFDKPPCHRDESSTYLPEDGQHTFGTIRANSEISLHI